MACLSLSLNGGWCALCPLAKGADRLALASFARKMLPSEFALSVPILSSQKPLLQTRMNKTEMVIFHRDLFQHIQKRVTYSRRSIVSKQTKSKQTRSCHFIGLTQCFHSVISIFEKCLILSSRKNTVDKCYWNIQYLIEELEFVVNSITVYYSA